MVGSARNRRNLAMAIRERGFEARDLTRSIVLGRVPGSFASEVDLENGRRRPYLRVRLPHNQGVSVLCQHIDGSCQEVADRIVHILKTAGIKTV